MRTVKGLPTARGLASGPVFIYRGDGEVPIPEYLVESGSEKDELVRLKRALNDTKRDLENLIAVLRERNGGGDVQVFECHLMLLEDIILVKETEKYILEDRLNAEAAVRKTADRARGQFARMNDPYFRERVRDLDDVERRLLKVLAGVGSEMLLDVKVPSIVVADDLTPSETVQLPRKYVLGFATNSGSTTSHVALIARAMGIPAVSGLGNITELVSPGETVLLDGTAGTVTVGADAETVCEFERQAARQREVAEEVPGGAAAGTLKDGGEVLLCANIHPGLPMDGLSGSGARGIGLYRSEYLWLNRTLEPTEEEEFAAYREVAQFVSSLGEDAFATIRVLDIGGDKIVRGTVTKEQNPFLGNRSIRYLLANPDVMRKQVRSVLRASAFGRLRMMYPMVSCVEELDESARILEETKRELDAKGIAYDRTLRVGAMVEVPSAAINADAFARKVDFLSIGTNDLVQYVMAADRGNDAVARLYQPANPAILKLVANVVAAAKRNGIEVGVCGASAADPVLGTLWAAMGAGMLSMSALYIRTMARLFSRLSRADLDGYAAYAASLDDAMPAEGIYGACRGWLAARVPDFEKLVI
jgi:phosphotransferase system enzyme I (PtsI)